LAGGFDGDHGAGGDRCNHGGFGGLVGLLGIAFGFIITVQRLVAIHFTLTLAAVAAAALATGATTGAFAVRAFLAVSDRPGAALNAIAALAGPNDAALKAAVAGWRARLSGMAAQGVPLERATLAAAFGRAFGYYDGYLFEVRSAGLGDERPIAAGGRYDGLPGKLGVSTTNTGAVGFMVRPARAYAGGGE